MFSESFDEVDGAEAGSDNIGNVNWVTTCATCLDGDFNEVFNGQLFNNDSNGPGIWFTSPITTSCSDFQICFDMAFQGVFEACGTGCLSADWVSLEYNIDGTGWQSPGNSYFCSGDCAGLNVIWDGGSSTANTTYCSGLIPAGNTVELRIMIQTWAAAEQIRIDNISVECFCTPPTLIISDPEDVCENETVDLTNASITAGSDAGTLTYWQDINATIPLVNPSMVAASGTYYIQLSNGDCASIEPVDIVINSNPSPNAGPDLDGCEGEVFTIGNDPIYPINGSSYTWDNGAGSGVVSLIAPIDNGTVNVTPSSTTTYTLTVTDLNGCEGTDEMVVSVTPLQIPSFTLTNQYCQFDTPENLSTTSDNGLMGSWSPSSIQTNTIGVTNYYFTSDPNACVLDFDIDIAVGESYTFNEAYQICAGSNYTFPDGSQQVVNSDLSYVSLLQTSIGCDSTIVTDLTVVESFFTEEFISICPGTSYTFPDGSQQVVNSNLTYDSEFVSQLGCDSIVRTTLTTIVSYYEQLTFEVCKGEGLILPNGVEYFPMNSENQQFNFVNQFGCDSIIDVNILVFDLPLINAGNDVVICEGESYVLNATGGVSYTWSNGLDNGTEFTPSESVLLSVDGTDVNNCSFSDEIQITVELIPNAHFTIENGEGCGPLTVLLRPSYVDENEDNECNWLFSNGVSVGNCESFQYTFADPGIYSVEYIVTTPNGCQQSMVESDAIVVYESPIAQFEFLKNPISTLNPEVQCVNQSTGATNYLWDFDNEMTSTETNPSMTYDEVGASYQITLYASNDNGCIDSTERIILVDVEQIFFVPNAFTPDADEVNNVFTPVFTSGIDITDYELTIFNRWGQIIFESRDPNIGWDGVHGGVGNLTQDGVYVWRIQYKDINVDDRRILTGTVTIVR